MLALVVGLIIGAGIFRTPTLVAGVASSEGMLLLAWLAGGLLSLVGALCYAELASTYPHMGGDYHFLGRAFGQRLAFFYGWARLSVIQTGSMALLAYVYGDYMAQIVPLGAASGTIHAAMAVVAITALNWAGIRFGAGAQRWLTLAEVSGLGLVIVAGLMLAPADVVAPTVTGDGSLGLMLVFVLLTYGGWSEAAYISAEYKGNPRHIGRIMLISLGIVTLLYLLANLAFLNALGMAGMAASDAPAAAVMQRAFGPSGAAILSLIIAIAALTSANATAITGARTSCALGRNFPALRWLGHWDMARDTPGNALLVQGAVALALVAAGAFARDGFTLAVEYTAPVFWFFLLLTGIALFVLRAREPRRYRPFSVPLFPILPVLFCLTSAFLLWSSVVYTGWGALAGIAVLAVGGVFLVIFNPTSEKESGT